MDSLDSMGQILSKFPDRIYISAIAGKAWKDQGAHGGDSVVHSGGLVANGT